MDVQAQLKLKINNSYESEPSSGSGSLLGDQNDGPISDEDNIHFPYLLKSKSNNYDENIITYDNKNRKLVFGRPAHSSQESPFEGFDDTPPEDSIKDPMDEILVKCLKKFKDSLKKNDLPETKKSFTSFTMVEENSCNAVDMQLSNEPVISQSNSSSNSFDNNQQQLTDLSFNGKFKSLNKQQNADSNEQIKNLRTQNLPGTSNQKRSLERQENVLEMSLNSSQFTESFILKRYSNEKSPDLFGDDEDEDEEEEPGKEPELAEKTIREQILDDKQDDENLEENENEAETFTRRTTKQETRDENDMSLSHSLNCPTETSFVDEQTMDNSIQMNSNDPLTLFRNNCRRERELLKRTKKCLAGIPPPPSFTILQLDMFNAVLDKKTEILNFFNSANQETNSPDNPQIKSDNIIFKPTHSLEETKKMGWREILGVRQHGVCYNLNKASENHEYLSLSVIERFIGNETATSYRNSPSSAKKRVNRLRMLTQSPGNRLSHLAKRRAIFSSANLATTSLKSTNSLGPQIVIDNKRKIKNRRKATPKRMTPASKRKNRKTPSSSAKKKLFRCDLIKPGPSRENSKRALFQSPAKQQQQQQNIVIQANSVLKPEIANRVEKSKRALFSPEIETCNSSSATLSTASSLSSSALVNSTNSSFRSYVPSKEQFAPKVSPQLESLLKRKRNLAEEEDITGPSNKLFKGNGENLTPRALKIKSQSFCIGAGSSTTSSTNNSFNSNSLLASTSNRNLTSSQMSLNNNGDKRTLIKLQRAHSDMPTPVSNLTENQKKKLLWAVSQALQEKKISSKHESFKQYASVLARVVKRIFTEYYQKTSTSNSETMLRLAKRYAYHVISGKNLDDIYLQAKAQIDESKRQSTTKVSGYIGPEEYQQRKLSMQKSLTNNSFCNSMPNIFATENSIDSFNVTLNESTSTLCPTTSTANSSLTQKQNAFLEHVSQEKLHPQQNSSHKSSKQQSIQMNPTALNSSSKSNLGGLALRENVDGEQRRSTQKNFTGKDQRNISPYINNNSNNTSQNSGRNLLGSGRKVQSEYFNEILSSSGGRVKRQILFDS